MASGDSNLSDTPAPAAPRTIGLTRLLLIVGGISMTLVLFTAMRTSYYGNLFTESLSFYVNDGWCNFETQGLGIHCFGDFGTWRSADLSVDLFLGINAANNPFVLLLGFPYQFLPYQIGAQLNSLLLFGSLTAPLFIETRSSQLAERIGIILFIGVWNIGTIATIDRGNHIGFVVLLLYLYLRAVQQQEWNKAIIWLGVLACLKWWCFLFVIPLLARKKWACAFKAGMTSAIITYAALGLFPGSLLFKVQQIFQTVTSRDIGSSAATFSISANTLWVRIGCLVRGQPSCTPWADWANGPVATSIKLMLLGSVCGLLWRLIKHGGYDSEIGMALLPTIGIVGIPEAQLYNSSLLTVTIALLLRFERSVVTYSQNVDSATEFQKVRCLLGAMSAVAIAPISWRTTVEFPLAVFQGLAYEFRIQYITIPAILIMMQIIAAIWHFRYGRIHEQSATNS